MQGYNQQTYPRSIENAVNILEANISEISTVSSWANHVGYSRSYFSTSFTECFGESPSRCLKRKRYQYLHKMILQFPHETSLAIARRLGFGDEQSLYKFLRRHYNTNFTEVRNKLLNGKA